MVARDIDRKLRLTAALIGAITRKDLAAAFRRVNAATPFDIERAHKWLQGRARPREQQVYEDWVKLLDIDRSAQWVADCDSEAFLAAICARHQRDPDTLRRRVDGANPPAGKANGQALAGTYACYHHSVSPYYRGRLIRGELTIATAPAPQRLAGTYEETVTTGRRFRLDGVVTLKRVLHIDVSDAAGDAQIAFCLFPPAPLASVLAGLMCCAPLIGPEVQPSVTRIAMIRLPAASLQLRDTPAPLPPQGSVAEDLAALGLPVSEPALVDQRIAAFLGGGDGGGVDQIAASAYRALVELFDPTWLAAAHPGQPPAATLSSDVTSMPDRRGSASPVVRLRRK